MDVHFQLPGGQKVYSGLITGGSVEERRELRVLLFWVGDLQDDLQALGDILNRAISRVGGTPPMSPVVPSP